MAEEITKDKNQEEGSFPDPYSPHKVKTENNGLNRLGHSNGQGGNKGATSKVE